MYNERMCFHFFSLTYQRLVLQCFQEPNKSCHHCEHLELQCNQGDIDLQRKFIIKIIIIILCRSYSWAFVLWHCIEVLWKNISCLVVVVKRKNAQFIQNVHVPPVPMYANIDIVIINITYVVQLCLRHYWHLLTAWMSFPHLSLSNECYTCQLLGEHKLDSFDCSNGHTRINGDSFRYNGQLYRQK